MQLKKWGEFDIPTEKPDDWDIHTLSISFKHVTNELWISHRHLPPESSAITDGVEVIQKEPAWSRWALKKQYKKIRIRPVFPDRPVVVKPEYPFKITKESKARIYVRVPIWVKLEVGATDIIDITQIPSVILSNTWFGSVTQGELCYWISTSARLEIEEDLTRPYLAICPVQIINDSDRELSVEKLCFRGAGLSLFDHNGQLWSDETVAKYKGPNEITEIVATGKVPSRVAKAVKLSGPVEEFKSGFRALTFATIKELPGMGFLTK